MTRSDPPPTENEFETFSDQLDAFLSGYFAALGIQPLPAYCQGDFFEERTEAIHFKDSASLTPALTAALERWLDVPRRRNWRIVVPSNDYLVIYAQKRRSATTKNG